MLSRLVLMVQAAVLDGQFLDLLPPFDNASMRKLLAICFAVGVLLFLGNTAFSADYQKGYDAHLRGDYATALRAVRISL